MDLSGPLPQSAKKIRQSLLAINSIMVATGTALLALGAKIDEFLKVHTENSPRPLWWIGLVPVLLGLAGVVAAASSRRKWVLCWVLMSMVVGGGSYIILAFSGCLDSNSYGVAVQAFGTCHDANLQCLCVRVDQEPIVLKFSSCDHIQHVTTLYLTLVCVLIVCITFGVLGTVLGCVATMCIYQCHPKEYDDEIATMAMQSPAHQTIFRNGGSNYSGASIALSPLTEISMAERDV